MTAKKAVLGSSNRVTVIVSMYRRKKVIAKYTVVKPSEVKKYLIEYERRQNK